jgi:hypothetical protein
LVLPIRGIQKIESHYWLSYIESADIKTKGGRRQQKRGWGKFIGEKTDDNCSNYWQPKQGTEHIGIDRIYNDWDEKRISQTTR